MAQVGKNMAIAKVKLILIVSIILTVLILGIIYYLKNMTTWLESNNAVPGRVEPVGKGFGGIPFPAQLK